MLLHRICRQSYCLGSSFPSGSRQNGVMLDDLLEVIEPDISELFLLSRSLHLTSRLLLMIGGSKDIEGRTPWDSESYLPRSLPRPLTLWFSLVCWAELSREALYGKLVMGWSGDREKVFFLCWKELFSSWGTGKMSWSETQHDMLAETTPVDDGQEGTSSWQFQFSFLLC